MDKETVQIETVQIETVTAKFKCVSVTNFGGSKSANLSAVYGTTGENADFARATPSGQLQIGIDAGVPASDFFKPGESYYLVFKKAPKNS